jgi:pimeloyl-ACP methyl ester carboxylesterase
MTAPLVLFALLVPTANPTEEAALMRLGGDPSPGVLANRSPGARPFDPPDPARPTVVFVHGFNPMPRVFHYTMTERLSEAVARRGGPPLNVLSWEWNAATFVSVKPRVNDEATIGQGLRLARSLLHHGLDPWRTHLIGQSSGTIVAASAARALSAQTGRPVAQLTLLDPAEFYHDVVFDRLEAGLTAARVENYWAPGLSGFGRAVGHPGVRNVRVAGPTPRPGAAYTPRSAHLNVVRWYLDTVADAAAPGGFNASVSAAPPR